MQGWPPDRLSAGILHLRSCAPEPVRAWPAESQFYDGPEPPREIRGKKWALMESQKARPSFNGVGSARGIRDSRQFDGPPFKAGKEQIRGIPILRLLPGFKLHGDLSCGSGGFACFLGQLKAVYPARGVHGLREGHTVAVCRQILRIRASGEEGHQAWQDAWHALMPGIDVSCRPQALSLFSTAVSGHDGLRSCSVHSGLCNARSKHAVGGTKIAKVFDALGRVKCLKIALR